MESEQDTVDDHQIEHYLGPDAHGIPYVRCTCGQKYPKPSGACPVAPATEESI